MSFSHFKSYGIFFSIGTVNYSFNRYNAVTLENINILNNFLNNYILRMNKGTEYSFVSQMSKTCSHNLLIYFEIDSKIARNYILKDNYMNRNISNYFLNIYNKKNFLIMFKFPNSYY